MHFPIWCACVNEWNALREASEEPCSSVPQWPHKAYGRNLSGVYTDLPMPAGTQCLLRELTRNAQRVWTELSFLGQTFRSLWPFHNSLETKSTNLIYRIIGFQGTCNLCCYCVLGGLGLKLGLVVRKSLASLGIESLEARWSSSSKSISEVKGYSDWSYTSFFFPLVTLALSGPEEDLIPVWWCLEGTSQFKVRAGLIVVRNILRVVHKHSGDECVPQRALLGKHSGRLLWLHPGWHQRQASWRAARQSGMPSGLPLVHPQPVLVVEPGGTSVMPALVRDRLSPTRKEKLLV